MAGIFDTGIFDTGIFDHGGAAASPVLRGSPEAQLAILQAWWRVEPALVQRGYLTPNNLPAFDRPLVSSAAQLAIHRAWLPADAPLVGPQPSTPTGLRVDRVLQPQESRQVAVYLAWQFPTFVPTQVPQQGVPLLPEPLPPVPGGAADWIIRSRRRHRPR